MSTPIQPDDLGFFVTVATHASLTAAARELGLTTAAVSKHLSQMEARLSVALVNRSTRRMRLTPEGELYLERARNILGAMDDLAQTLKRATTAPQGLLRVNATLGFGRTHIAPLISKFVRLFPAVDVQLQLSVDPPPISEDGYDVCIRFGEPPDARVIARRVASNRRVLCAAPSYFKTQPLPRRPADLARLNCIGIRQGDDGYGLWRLTSGRGAAEKTQNVRVRGNLTTNDGEIAVKWALDGHGVLMRAEWDVAQYFADGRLIHVLPDHRTPAADIYAVYAPHLQGTARVKAFVDFVARELPPR